MAHVVLSNTPLIQSKVRIVTNKTHIKLNHSFIFFQSFRNCFSNIIQDSTLLYTKNQLPLKLLPLKSVSKMNSDGFLGSSLNVIQFQLKPINLSVTLIISFYINTIASNPSYTKLNRTKIPNNKFTQHPQFVFII